MSSALDVSYGRPQIGEMTHRISTHDAVSAAFLDNEKAAHEPRDWPTTPSRIKVTLLTVISCILFDVALFSCSVAFLVFAQLVVRYDQTPTIGNLEATNLLRSATKYGPTIFPLLFASVVGRAAHAILLWRLEKGERVQVLDTLATSTSLTSTVTSQFQLRHISAWGTILVAIWALSPVGGQASIRQMTIGNSIITEQAAFQVTVPNGHIQAFQLSDNFITYLTINTLFIGAMIAPQKTRSSPTDAWGNVKIPRIEHFENSAELDKDGWYTVPTENDKLDMYPSFVGLPMHGFQANVTTTDYDFHAQTPYLVLKCKPRNETDFYRASLPTTAEGGQNVTGYNGLIWWSSNETESRMKDSPDDLRPFNFSYIPMYGPYSVLTCSMTTSYVEAEISCTVNSTCRPAKIRRSQLKQLPPSFTFLDIHWQYWFVFLQGFMSSLGQSKGSGSFNYFDKYLTDPTLPISQEIIANVTLQTEEDYSIRFGQLLNSYFACMYGMYTLTGGITNDTSYFWDTNQTFVPEMVSEQASRGGWGGNYNWTGDVRRKSRVWPAEGTKHVHVEIIVAHKIWTTILTATSILLIVCSLVSPLVRFFLTKGPDIALNFSSLAVRNNAYALVPHTGTYLDAAIHFKLLKNVRLRFSDTDPKAKVSNLVVGSYGNGQFEITRIHKGRVYE